MEYSKISTVELINFMSYKHAKVCFDDRNIINIKGYNDSGKTTILRAMAVCMMNMYNRSQNKFIRHGEDYFRVIISFDDGVSIIRDKYINGQSLYEMYKDEKLIFTTKEGNRLTKVEVVPKPIEDYLGLCMLDIGCLNFQNRRDKMWLVESTGGENYYTIHEALKTEEIARANALLNSDKNALGSEITAIEQDLQSAQLLLNEYSSLEEGLLISLTEKETMVQGICARSVDAFELVDIVDKLSAIPELPYIEGIDVAQLKSISLLENTLQSLDNLPKLPALEGIQTERLDSIEKIESTMVKLSNHQGKTIGTLLDTVDIKRLLSLGELQNTLKSLAGILKEIKEIKSEIRESKKELIGIVENAHQEGISFVQCDNCGSYLEVSVGE